MSILNQIDKVMEENANKKTEDETKYFEMVKEAAKPNSEIDIKEIMTIAKKLNKDGEHVKQDIANEQMILDYIEKDKRLPELWKRHGQTTNKITAVGEEHLKQLEELRKDYLAKVGILEQEKITLLNDIKECEDGPASIARSSNHPITRF